MSRALPPPVCSLACLGAARRVLPVLADKCVPGIPRPGVEVKCQSSLPKAKQNCLSMSTLIGPDRLGACFFAARIANNRTGADCPAVPCRTGTGEYSGTGVRWPGFAPRYIDAAHPEEEIWRTHRTAALTVPNPAFSADFPSDAVRAAGDSRAPS